MNPPKTRRGLAEEYAKDYTNESGEWFSHELEALRLKAHEAGQLVGERVGEARGEERGFQRAVEMLRIKLLDGLVNNRIRSEAADRLTELYSSIRMIEQRKEKV